MSLVQTTEGHIPNKPPAFDIVDQPTTGWVHYRRRLYIGTLVQLFGLIVAWLAGLPILQEPTRPGSCWAVMAFTRLYLT
jgi:hypothetical protein